MLEVGAGIGNLTELLVAPPARGDVSRERVVATELSEQFLAGLRKRFRGHANVVVEQLDLGDVPVERVRAHGVDTVLCVNVLEHVRDDAAALARLAEALPAGGKLLLYVPALPWLYGSLDQGLQHHRRYSREELRMRLSASGWRIIHMSYMNLLGIPGWFLSSRMLRRKLLPVKQVHLYEKLTGILRVEDRFRLPIGMSLVAVGERR